MKIRRFVVLRRRLIPDLDDVEATFRTNGDAIDLIAPLFGQQTGHGSDAVVQIAIHRIPLLTTKGVIASTDVLMVLPQRRNRVPHQEEHALREALTSEGIHDGPEVSPGFHGTQTNERIHCPFALFWGVEIQSP